MKLYRRGARPYGNPWCGHFSRHFARGDAARDGFRGVFADHHHPSKRWGEAEPAPAHSEQRIYVTALLDAEYTSRYIYLPIVFVDLPPHENAGAASGTFQRCGPPD